MEIPEDDLRLVVIVVQLMDLGGERAQLEIGPVWHARRGAVQAECVGGMDGRWAWLVWCTRKLRLRNTAGVDNQPNYPKHRLVQPYFELNSEADFQHTRAQYNDLLNNMYK